MIKKSFREYFENIMGKKEFSEFAELPPENSSIQVNTIKASAKAVERRLKAQGFELKKIKYLDNAYEITHKPFPLGKTLEHVLGYIYIQGAASMLPPVAMNPKKDSIILDMSAAPGGKTILLSNLVDNTGVIVANDPDFNRMKILQVNIQRCGLMNTIVTRLNGISFAKKEQKYDYILLDAPCSASGTFRNNNHVAEMWSKNGAYKLSNLQKKLLDAAYKSLKPGGTIVYSTCSISVEENETVIDSIIDKHDIDVVPVKLRAKTRPAITEYGNKRFRDSIKNCVRVYPQDNNTEGFFIAKLRRPE